MAYFSYVLISNQSVCVCSLYVVYETNVQQWHTFGLINYITAAMFVLYKIKISE